MGIKIGHASIDENGKVAGGKLGDQTKKEVCIREWYNKPWNVYLECTDKVIADKAASYMEKFCANDNIGYDQTQRLTMYHSVIANNYNVVKAKGEADCSSAVSAAYIFAGLNISPACTTRNIKAVLIATGKFKSYTDAAHIASDKLAKRGSIHLSEGHHVIMNLENGSGIKSTNAYPIPDRIIRLGCLGTDVKWVQDKLIKNGIKEVVIDGVKKKVSIDGECGPITDKAIRIYQDKHNLGIDGEVGPKTRTAMIKK